MTVLEFLEKVRKISSWKRTPAISDVDLEDLINQINMSKKDKQYSPYPILGSKPKQYIPYGLLLQHENQAWENHGQSLRQLEQRGGLSWAESLAIIEGKKWRESIQNDNEAEPIVKGLVAEFMKFQER